MPGLTPTDALALLLILGLGAGGLALLIGRARAGRAAVDPLSAVLAATIERQDLRATLARLTVHAVRALRAEAGSLHLTGDDGRFELLESVGVTRFDLLQHLAPGDALLAEAWGRAEIVFLHAPPFGSAWAALGAPEGGVLVAAKLAWGTGLRALLVFKFPWRLAAEEALPDVHAIAAYGGRVIAEFERSSQVGLALRDLLQTQDQMARTVAHDLSHALTGATADVLALQAGAADPGAGSEAQTLTRLEQRLNMAGQMLQDLASPDRPLAAGPIALGVLRDLLRDINASRRLPGRRVVLALDPALPDVRGELGQVLRVFENLVLNALRHNAGRDSLTITLSAAREGEAVRFTVADDGVGIPPAARAQLFAFAQKRGPGAGQGIGLYSCSRIVAQHGGAIGVDSAPGAGAAFWFTLPVWREAAGA